MASFAEKNFDFQILIKTEGGKERAYCGYQETGSTSTVVPSQTRNFIAVDYDKQGQATHTFDGAWNAPGSGKLPQYKFCSGEIYHKLRNMVSCSFEDWPWGEHQDGSPTTGTADSNGPARVNGKYFYDEPSVTVSLQAGTSDFYNESLTTDEELQNARAISTGSITFKQVSGQADPIKEIKFWGQKVCDVLGLPEAVWVTVDAVHIDATDNNHSFRGNIIGSNLTVHEKFIIPQGADIGAGLPFKIYNDTFEKLIKYSSLQTNNHTNNLLIGYAADVDNNYSDYPSSGTGYAERKFRISTTGAIGAGTLTPSYPLHVSGSWYSQGVGAVFEYGRVGIGTKTPIHALHVATASGYAQVAITTDGDEGTDKSLINLGTTSNPTMHGIEMVQGSPGVGLTGDGDGFGRMFFNTMGSPRMTIDYLGRVGIGDSTPSKVLTVNGDISSSADIYLKEGRKVIWGDASTTGGWIEGTANHIELRHIQGTSEAAIQVDTYGMIKFANHWNGVNPSTDLDINDDLRMIISGSNVGIGTSTPRKRLHIVNSGIAITGASGIETQDPWDDARFIIDSGVSTGHHLMKLSNDNGNCLWVQGDRVYMNVPLAIGQESLTGYGSVVADSNDLVVEGQFSAGGSAGSAIYKLQIGDQMGIPSAEGDLSVGNDLNLGAGHIHSDNTIKFLTAGGSAQKGNFSQIYCGTTYANDGSTSGTVDTLNGYLLQGTAVIDSSKYAYFDRLYIGAGANDGYFYSDSDGRTAFIGGDFYIRPEVTNTYIYSTNIYLGGNSANDYIKCRASTISGTSWSIPGNGNASLGSIQVVGLTTTNDVSCDVIQTSAGSGAYKNFGSLDLFASNDGNITTVDFMAALASYGMITSNAAGGGGGTNGHSHLHAVGKVQWNYAGSCNITDGPHGESIELAGCVVEVFNNGTTYYVRISSPTTTNGGTQSRQIYAYNYQGSNYSPGWFKIMTSIGDQYITGDLDVSGPLSVGGNLDMTDGHIMNVREIELKDWDDDDGGSNDTVRVLRRGNSWQFHNGGVKIGSYASSDANLGTGNLKVSGNVTAATFTGDGSGLTGISFGGGSAIDCSTIRMSATGDAAANSTTHAFQIGATNSTNVIMDTNELMARNNGSVAEMHINPDGSNVTIGNNVTTANLHCRGDVVAYYSSDKKLKKNIIQIDNAIEKISQLSGMTFEWKKSKDKKYYNKREAGIIAQDVLKVLPEAVKDRGESGLAVKYEQLIPLLIEGIKEQQEQIDDLKQEVKKLKSNK